MHTHVHAFLIFGLCNYYLKREGSVMFVVFLCILFCGFCESIYMCALQYCRQVKSINESFTSLCQVTTSLIVIHKGKTLVQGY